jgi:hypothetical protein
LFTPNLEESTRIPDRRLNLQAIPHDPWIRKQGCHFFLAVIGYPLNIELIECRSIVLTFPENRYPGEPCLRTLQNEHLKQASVLVNGLAPFEIMVPLIQFVISTPRTALDIGDQGNSPLLDYE